MAPWRNNFCRLPAPIPAERFGFHHARAAKWVREAGRTYADYVALRADPRRKVFSPKAH
jgi:hypothetical protein